MTAASELRVAIVAQAAASEMRGERVNNHVAGTGVESEDVFGLRSGGEHGEVGDAADIQGDAATARIAIKKIVDERHERRALASSGDVGGTKIGDGCDAGALGDDGWLGKLKSGGDARAEKHAGRALMVESLAVGADERNATGRDAELATGAQNRVGE